MLNNVDGPVVRYDVVSLLMFPLDVSMGAVPYFGSKTGGVPKGVIEEAVLQDG